MSIFRILLTFGLVLGGGFALIPTKSAAAAEPSLGCAAIDGLVATANPAVTTDQNAFEEGELITISVTGPGDTFTVTVDGEDVGTDPVGTEVTYEVVEAGVYQLGVNVSGATTPNTQAHFGCEAASGDDDDDGDGGKVTVCHRPPGNPGNAHTISVGGGALNAHLGHGDSEGECSDEEESRRDDGDVITFSDEIAGIIQIYGLCIGVNCNEIAVVDMDELEPVEGFQIEFDLNPSDNWYVIVYFLGDSHLDITINVFQVNIYGNGVLQTDNLLIFMSDNGTITTELTD